MTRELFDEIPVALVRTSIDGRIARVNPAARALLELRDAREGELSIDLLGVPLSERMLRQRVLEAQPVVTYEASIRTFGGRVIDVEATSRALRDGEGRVRGYETAMRDTSTLVQATRALRERQDHFRALAEAIRDVCIAVDEDLRVTHWNAAAEDLSGVRADVALGRVLVDLVPGVGDTLPVRALHEAMRTHRAVTYRCETRVIGEGRCFDTSVYPLPNGALLIALETTPQRRMQAELAASEAKLRSILEEQDDAIARGLADGTLTFVNLAFCDLVKRSRDELVGTRASEAPLAALFALGDALSPENPTLRTVARHTDGRAYEWTLRGVFDDDGELAELQCAGRDITTLHDMIAEREVLLREVHHRVKNNLQIVSSLLNLQLQSENDPKLLALLAESQRRIQAMALIHEHVYRSSEVAELDAGAYVRHVVGAIVQARPAGGATVRADADPVTLDLDTAMRVGLIVSELVSNGVLHAYPAGGGEVRLEVRAAASGDLVIGVADDGVGLPPEVRVEDATTFGLQLVRELAAHLHAALKVERAGGTRVTITVPRREGAKAGA